NGYLIQPENVLVTKKPAADGEVVKPAARCVAADRPIAVHVVYLRHDHLLREGFASPRAFHTPVWGRASERCSERRCSTDLFLEKENDGRKMLSQARSGRFPSPR